MDGPFDSPRDDPTWLIPDSPGLDSPRASNPDPSLVSPRSVVADAMGGDYHVAFLS